MYNVICLRRIIIQGVAKMTCCTQLSIAGIHIGSVAIWCKHHMEVGANTEYAHTHIHIHGYNI